jgi:hypothetical protein
MNERIKELAEQAGLVKILEEHASEYGGGTFENTPYPELEKFAELIVKECFHLFVSDHDEEHDEILESIKEHFGVE